MSCNECNSFDKDLGCMDWYCDMSFEEMQESVEESMKSLDTHEKRSS